MDWPLEKMTQYLYYSVLRLLLDTSAQEYSRRNQRPGYLTFDRCVRAMTITHYNDDYTL